MIASTCPSCQFAITRADKEAGLKIECPSCGQRLKIPQPPPPPKDRTVLGQIQSPTATQTVLGQLTTQPAAEPEPIEIVPDQEGIPPPAGWYANVLGEQLGPFTPAQLQQMASDGSLAPDDHVTQEGSNQWIAASLVKGLKFPGPRRAMNPQLPPLPAQRRHAARQGSNDLGLESRHEADPSNSDQGKSMTLAAHEDALSTVRTPATLLSIYGGYSCVLAALLFVAGVVHVQPGGVQWMRDLTRALLLSGPVGLTIGALVITGAICMRRLSSYTWALIGTLAAFIPSIPCCSAYVSVVKEVSEKEAPWLVGLTALHTFLGAPLAIWCMVALHKPKVSSAFRQIQFAEDHSE
jgi:hypothetical protein